MMNLLEARQWTSPYGQSGQLTEAALIFYLTDFDAWRSEIGAAIVDSVLKEDEATLKAILQDGAIVGGDLEMRRIVVEFWPQSVELP